MLPPLRLPIFCCRDRQLLFPLEILINEDSVIGRRKWKQAQILSNHFWTRWVREYLTTLHLRQKWLKPQRDVRVGDLVLVHEKKIPRGL